MSDYELLMERRNLFVTAMGQIESILRTYRLYDDVDAQTQAERDCIAVLRVVGEVFDREDAMIRTGQA